MHEVEAVTKIQAHYRGYLVRKRNREIDLKFASLVAEIAPSKLLEFWDTESLSRKSTRKAADCQKSDIFEEEVDLETPKEVSVEVEQVVEVPSSPKKDEITSEVKVEESKAHKALQTSEKVDFNIVSKRELEAELDKVGEVVEKEPISKTAEVVEASPVVIDKPKAFEQLGLKSSPAKNIGAILSEAGFTSKIDKSDLTGKRKQLLSDLWAYQSAILERRQTHHG